MEKSRSCILKRGHLGLLFTDNIHTTSAKNITAENRALSPTSILHSFEVVKTDDFEGCLWIQFGSNFKISSMKDFLRLHFQAVFTQ